MFSISCFERSTCLTDINLSLYTPMDVCCSCLVFCGALFVRFLWSVSFLVYVINIKGKSIKIK